MFVLDIQQKKHKDESSIKSFYLLLILANFADRRNAHIYYIDTTLL